MSTCDDWDPLIARAVEGGIDADAAARLMAHLADCARCRFEAESQLLVKRVLAERDEEPVPAGFTARLSAALDEEAAAHWIELGNWRKWGIRLLPAAAALLAVAVVAEQPHFAGQPVDLSSAVVSWGTEEGGVTDLFTRTDVTDESRLVALVTGQSDVDAAEQPR